MQLTIIFFIAIFTIWGVWSNSMLTARDMYVGQRRLCPDCSGGLVCFHTTARSVVLAEHGVSDVSKPRHMKHADWEELLSYSGSDTVKGCHCWY